MSLLYDLNILCSGNKYQDKEREGDGRILGEETRIKVVREWVEMTSKSHETLCSCLFSTLGYEYLDIVSLNQWSRLSFMPLSVDLLVVHWRNKLNGERERESGEFREQKERWKVINLSNKFKLPINRTQLLLLSFLLLQLKNLEKDSAKRERRDRKQKLES